LVVGSGWFGTDLVDGLRLTVRRRRGCRHVQGVEQASRTAGTVRWSHRAHPRRREALGDSAADLGADHHARSFAGTVWAVEARASANNVSPASSWVRILRSTDGGQSWSQLGLLRPQFDLGVPTDLATQLVFASARFGAVTLFSPSSCAMHGCGIDEVLTTSDGGDVWSLATLPGTSFGCGTPIGAVAASPGAKILVNLGTEGQCPSERDHVDETGDGGRTWHMLRTVGFAPDPSSMVIPSAEGWAASSTALLRTVDAGLDWTQVLPPPSPVNGIDFLSLKLGVGWGTLADPSALLVTRDGGRTWRQVSAIGSDYLAVEFTDSVQGWAVVTTGESEGGTAKVLTTADGGRRWKASSPMPDNTAKALALTGLQTGEGLEAISAEWARIVVSSQSGPPSSPCRASGPDLLLSTRDGGRTWTVAQLPLEKVPVVAANFAGPAGGLVSGASQPGCPGALELSLDGGSRWSVVSSVPSVGGGAPATPGYALDALGPDRACFWLTRFGDALGQPEKLVLGTGLLQTADGGHTWTRYLLPPSLAETRLVGAQWPVGLGPVAIQFLPREPTVSWMLLGAEFALGSPTTVRPVLWRTTDGGRHWVAVS